MEHVEAVENHRERETPLQRLFRNFHEFGVALLRTFLLSAIFVPVLLASFLTLDLPFRPFDRFFPEAIVRPSTWLSWGVVIMALGPLISILFARRYGGDEASRVVTASWGVAALLVFAEISYLAPQLDASDFPSITFVTAFVVSSMAAQFMAPAVYDVIRGGGEWWRAPLYSAMCGFAVGSVIYFPWVYWGVGAPWPNWLVGDLSVKLLMAFGFLPVYFFLRRNLRPRGGFGGR